MANLSKKTITRLYQVLDYINEEPKRFDMDFWGIQFDPKDPEQVKLAKRGVNALDHYNCNGTLEPNSPIGLSTNTLPPCGTAACLAGTAVLLFAPATTLKRLSLVTNEHNEITIFGRDTENVAQKLLGVPKSMFFIWRWPAKFRAMYDRTDCITAPKKRATARYNAVKAMIDAYIKHDGDWQSMMEIYKDA